MPTAISSNARGASIEPRTNDYDDAVDDFLRDIPMNNNDNTTNFQPEGVKDVDEEIKVRKKRTPIPKLDEALLLSDKGVPKLRKVVKTRLKFKGKGHEFNDMAKLLNTYQLWLDDLYPRAKFRDALTIVEKLGHGKRMQLTRKGWIDESKPNRKEDTPERRDEMNEAGPITGEQRDAGSNTADELFGDGGSHGQDDQNMPDEEDLDALLNNTTSHLPAKPAQKQRGPFKDDSDDEDELAALMAEHDTSKTSRPTQMNKRQGPFENDDNDDQDDLDALIAEHETRSVATTTHAPKTHREQAEEEDDDDLDALMAEHESHQVHETVASLHPEPRHAEDNLDDEEYLDALMAEQEPLKSSETKPGPDPDKQQRHHQDDVVDEQGVTVDMDDV